MFDAFELIDLSDLEFTIYDFVFTYSNYATAMRIFLPFLGLFYLLSSKAYF